mmetsp:Transcript_19881/g.34148  ORF Transcript_19881/g.34148 Transcript_19881/m.34148 type:complete len:242 (-) Transcript_19881:1347-2072(-)
MFLLIEVSSVDPCAMTIANVVAALIPDSPRLLSILAKVFVGGALFGWESTTCMEPLEKLSAKAAAGFFPDSPGWLSRSGKVSMGSGKVPTGSGKVSTGSGKVSVGSGKVSMEALEKVSAKAAAGFLLLESPRLVSSADNGSSATPVGPLEKVRANAAAVFFMGSPRVRSCGEVLLFTSPLANSTRLMPCSGIAVSAGPKRNCSKLKLCVIGGGIGTAILFGDEPSAVFNTPDMPWNAPDFP